MTRSARRSRRAAVLRAAIGLPGAFALLVALGGCQEHRIGIDNRLAAELGAPEKRHPVNFSQRSETLLVEVPRGPDGLSSNQRADIWQFVDRYKAESTGPLRLSSPVGLRDHLATSRSVQQVHEIIREAGVPDRAVASLRHANGKGPAKDHEPGSTIRLAFERPVAVPPTCGEWPEDLGSDRERIHFQNFGCATQRNLALMTNNPRDLIGPQPEDPRLGERRMVTWKAYTGAEKGNDGAEPQKPPEAAKSATTSQ